MTETLFALNQHNYRNCQSCFRGNNNREYYLGDFSIEAGSGIEVRADKKAAGGCSIIRLQSNTRLFFRRSWSHIREDSTDVTVLWFVKRESYVFPISAVTRRPWRAISWSPNPRHRSSSNAT